MITKVFFNLIIIGLLIYPLRGISVFCIHSAISALSLAVIIIIVVHLSWRSNFASFCRSSSGTIDLKIVKLPIKDVAIFIDTFIHPIKFPKNYLFTLGLALVTVTSILGLSPLSPFRIPEEMPTIQGYTIEDLTSHTKVSYLIRQNTVETKTWDRLLIQIETMETDLRCVWDAKKGKIEKSILPCAIKYTPPINTDRDVLTVKVKSPCNTKESRFGLHVIILP